MDAKLDTSGPPPVTVTVSNLTDPPTVTCDPHTVVVTQANSLVVFNLATPGYAFPATGSVVVQDGGGEFPNLWSISASQVALHDLCEIPAAYDYNVVVVEIESGKPFTVDPKISNEPH
ncbi:MAG: hypothetical protein ABW005_12880 [Burkholderiaceae bacterium]